MIQLNPLGFVLDYFYQSFTPSIFHLFAIKVIHTWTSALVISATEKLRKMSCVQPTCRSKIFSNWAISRLAVNILDFFGTNIGLQDKNHLGVEIDLSRCSMCVKLLNNTLNIASHVTKRDGKIRCYQICGQTLIA